MKRTLPLTLCLLAALLAGACAHHKIIPDEELALIFRDAFLANSYLGDRHPDTDSLKIYEPIFARYGYTTADVQYTIGNFSKRKSARLGDVVERSIELLEAEGKHYNREVAIRDTIDRVATRTFTRRIHADSLIRVRSLRDTARLRFAFDVSPGEYRIRLRYRVDSLDRNPSGLRGAMWLDPCGAVQHDHVPRPRGALHAHLHRRLDPHPPPPRTGELPRAAEAALDRGPRPHGGVHAAHRRGGRQPLRQATRYPYFRR